MLIKSFDDYSRLGWHLLSLSVYLGPSGFQNLHTEIYMGPYEFEMFCKIKDIIWAEWQYPEWWKTFSNYTFDRQLVSWLHKEVKERKEEERKKERKEGGKKDKVKNGLHIKKSAQLKLRYRNIHKRSSKQNANWWDRL